MKKNEFEFALESLNSGKAVMIGTIIRQTGSSPRGPGTKIIINAEGNSSGTVGGGKQESDIFALLSSIIEKDVAKVVDIEFPEILDAKPDLRCGGNVSILLEPVFPQDTQIISMLMDVVKLLQRNQSGWLLSLVPNNRNNSSSTAKCLISSEGHIYGNLTPEVIIKRSFNK